MVVNLYDCIIQNLMVSSYPTPSSKEIKTNSDPSTEGILLGLLNGSTNFICTTELPTPGSRIIIGHKDLNVYSWDLIYHDDDTLSIKLYDTSLYWMLPETDFNDFIVLDEITSNTPPNRYKFKVHRIGKYFYLSLLTNRHMYISKESRIAKDKSYLIQSPIRLQKATFAS